MSARDRGRLRQAIIIDDGDSPPSRRWKNFPGRLASFFRSNRLGLAWRGFLLTVVCALLWTQMIVTIPAGHAGVLYRRFLGGTEMSRIYAEGIQVIFPWDRLYIFDTRIHEETHHLTVLSDRGLKVEMEVSVIFYPNPDRLPDLLTTVGQDYREKLVRPMLTTAVLSTAAGYPVEDFFSPRLLSMRDEILTAVLGDLGRRPVTVDNILIRSVRLPESFNQAIDDTLVAQQRVIEQEHKVRQAAEKYKISYIEASGVRLTQALVNPGLNPDFLRWQGIEATRLLAEGPNSKVVVIGGSDGLPLILNLDSDQRPSKAAASSAKPAARAAESLPVGNTEPEGWLEVISPEKLSNLQENLSNRTGLDFGGEASARKKRE
jgi:Membrane protease subunits, stomatin/prohibitin homologs